jgi:flagellin-specific chaperone FliS
MQQFTSTAGEATYEMQAMQRTGGGAQQNHAAAQMYRMQDCINLTPVEVIKKLYDFAILGCKKKDNVLAQKAITELIVGLNYEYQEISLPLFKLYQYAKRCIREGKPEEAVRVLSELRSTWSQAFGLKE